MLNSIDQIDFTSFTTDATAIPGSTFGAGTGPIFVDNSDCTGSEPRLLSCTYDPMTGDCTHSQDASVRCSVGPCKDKPCVLYNIYILVYFGEREGGISPQKCFVASLAGAQ